MDQSAYFPPRPSFHRIALVVLILAGLALSALAFASVRAAERHAARDSLGKIAGERIELLQADILRSTEVLHGLRSFHDAAPQLTREQFTALVASPLSRQPEIRALEWIPRVRAAQRDQFEADVRAAGFDQFHFTQLDPAGRPVVAARRDFYYPVYYLEPLATNRPAFGYDLGSDPVRRAAIETAASTGTLVATAPVRLAQDGKFGFLVLLPVYAGQERLPTTALPPHPNLHGFMLAVFSTDELISRALAPLAASGVDAQVTDCNSGTRLFSSGADGKTGLAPEASALAIDQNFEIAGRSWQLRLVPGPAFLAAHPSSQAFAALIAGLLMTLLLAAYVHHALRAQHLAQTASSAKSAFLANTSHEIRTPLNAMLGYARVLARQQDLPPHLQHAARTIVDSGAHLLTLLNDILDLSKIEAGRLTPQNNAFELQTFARSVVEIFGETCEHKGLVLTLKTPEPPLYVVTDERKLRQVLMNLLGNAVKFTDRGRVSLTITRASLEPGNCHYAFEVSDTGIGVPPEMREAIFDPFRQAPEGAARGGTGLGLALSRQFVEMLRGKLEYQPNGRGSSFSFSIPLPPADLPAVRAPERVERPRIPAPVTSDMPAVPSSLLLRLRQASELHATTDLKRLFTELGRSSPAHQHLAAELQLQLQRCDLAAVRRAVQELRPAECPAGAGGHA